MKKLLLSLLVTTISMAVLAQGNSHGKGKDKEKNKSEKQENKSDREFSRDNNNSSHGKSAGHQPKKVQAALLKDYPAANNVIWSKYKGDYTATFNNGVWRSTAVYHANGERRDTRTPLTRAQLPGSIWDRIFKRDRVTPVQFVQIERPTTVEKIFRILSSNNTAYYYDQNGNRVSYNY
ncbi:MAG: hypothetical protein ABIO04_01540 [Ferruginibacter sp.]